MHYAPKKNSHEYIFIYKILRLRPIQTNWKKRAKANISNEAAKVWATSLSNVS